MNNTAVSSTKPAASEPDGKPSGKEKPGDATQNTNPDQQETAAKEANQKGEKRKADPGKETSATREERYNNCISSKSTVVIMFNKCFYKIFFVSAGWFDIDENKNTNVYVSGWYC